MMGILKKTCYKEMEQPSAQTEHNNQVGLKKEYMSQQYIVIILIKLLRVHPILP